MSGQASTPEGNGTTPDPNPADDSQRSGDGAPSGDDPRVRKANEQAAAARVAKREAEKERDAAAARAAELEARLAAQEQAKLAEQGKWQELYEQSKAEVQKREEKMTREIAERDSRYQSLVKSLRDAKLSAAIGAAIPSHLSATQRARVASLVERDVEVVEWDSATHEPKADFAKAVAAVLGDLSIPLEPDATHKPPAAPASVLGRPNSHPPAGAAPTHRSPHMQRLSSWEESMRRHRKG